MLFVDTGHFRAFVWLVQCPERMAQAGLWAFSALTAQKEGESKFLQKILFFYITYWHIFERVCHLRHPCDQSDVLRRNPAHRPFSILSTPKRGKRFFTKCFFLQDWVTWESPCDPFNILRRWMTQGPFLHWLRTRGEKVSSFTKCNVFLISRVLTPFWIFFFISDPVATNTTPW